MGTVLLIADEVSTLRYEFRTKTWVSSPRVGGTGLCLHRRLAGTLREAEKAGVLNAPPASPFVLDF